MELPEQIETFREFFEVNPAYMQHLHEQVREGHPWVDVEFADLARHSPEIAELLLDQPEETLKAGQVAIEKMDLPHPGEAKERIEIRICNLPKQHQLAIRTIRAKHLEKFVEILGIVRQKSDVRPQVTSARFECPSCGNIIPVLQLDTKFKEPSRCGCGRKGKFKLLSKEMVDAQSLTLEEAPDELEGGEQPKRLKVLLQRDLVSPMTDRRTNPGSKIKIVGTIKEVPIVLQTGGQSTRFDLIMEANYVETMQEDFTEIALTPEDLQEIEEMSKDPDLFEKMVASIAPSIYGHEPIKQALLLQMFGGVHKSRDRGVKSRGDIHILLIGDPGAGKCVTGDALVQCGDGTIKPIKEMFNVYAGNRLPDPNAYEAKEAISLLSLGMTGKSVQNPVSTFWRRVEREPLLRVTLRSGETLTVTRDHPFLTTANCIVEGVAAKDVAPGTPVACPRVLDPQTTYQPFPAWRKSLANNAVRITTPAYVDERTGRLLGYLAGDGWMEKERKPIPSMVSVTSNEEAVLEDFESILSAFGVTCTRRSSHSGKTATETYACSSELHSLLAALAPELVRNAGEKSVPQAIMRSPKSVVSAFLSALFECDAHTSRRSRSIEYTTKSARMAKEVQMLLLRFGIRSQLRAKEKYATNTVHKIRRNHYEVAITGANVDQYVCSVGFISQRKKGVVSSAAHNTNRDVVPGISSFLRYLRQRHGLRQEEIGIPLGSYRHYERGDRMPSRKQLQRIVDAYADVDDPLVDLLGAFASADIFWNFVESVEEVPVPAEGIEVYDFEIAASHNFVAQTAYIHNSQLLKRISNIAPKARFVAGKGASGAGLTAAVVKDDFLRGWALEAGAMVLANRGIICIDELDKMTKEDTSAMHEALEQQTVSISKANIQATLRCETTVLAAANPKFGRFDPFEILSKQIDLPPALISRFDLIFPVRDLPDKTKDEKLASFILTLHKEQSGKEGIIDPERMKRYIAFARQRCHPKLTEPAVQEIKEYYVKMRGGEDGGEQQAIKAVPITARQLEALVRLSEASARVRLSEKVTKMDAQRAIELVHYCMQQIGLDPETGKFDMDRVMTGISASQRSHISIIKELIHELEGQIGKVIPIDDVVREAGIKGIAEDTAHDVIEKLKRGGDIYSPKHGFISRV